LILRATVGWLIHGRVEPGHGRPRRERSDVERVDAFVVRACRRAWDEGLTG
jgi:hypothetical protein